MNRAGVDIVKRAMQSSNFVTGSAGWKITADGNIEASNGTFRGTLVATTGTIGGFTIGATTLVGGAVTINSAGSISIVQSYLASTSMKADANGFGFYVGTSLNGLIILSAGDGGAPPSSAVLTFLVGNGVTDGITINIAKTGTNTGYLAPGAGDTGVDLGTSADFFNEINYKTLTDRGCLGYFDDGVELQDGRTVSDVEAIKTIKKHPTKKTIYGVPMLDYSSMPKVVYRPAPIATKDVLYPLSKQVRFKKGEPIGEDGAETTALISILIGSIKEVAGRIETLEKLNK